MVINGYEVRDALLMRYIIAGPEVHFSEVNERVIYLRCDPDRGLLLVGEIPGQGLAGAVNLAQVLLEFAITCQGCEDELSTSEMVDNFGRSLGKSLARQLVQGAPVAPVQDRLSEVFEILLNSMGGDYLTDHLEGRLSYELIYCPIQETARQNRMLREVPMAQRGFLALCHSLLEELAPNWALQRPIANEIGQPMVEICLAQVKA